MTRAVGLGGDPVGVAEEDDLALCLSGADVVVDGFAPTLFRPLGGVPGGVRDVFLLDLLPDFIDRLALTSDAQLGNFSSYFMISSILAAPWYLRVWYASGRRDCIWRADASNAVSIDDDGNDDDGDDADVSSFAPVLFSSSSANNTFSVADVCWLDST